MPVRTLVVEVVSGPDRGLRREADAETLAVGTAPGSALRLSDPAVSRYHLELRRADDGVRIIDLGSTNGTTVGSIRVERGTVPPGCSIGIGASVLKVSDGAGSSVPLVSGNQVGDLVGHTASMRRLFASIERASQTTVPVLVVGESGTGKELVARALHELGPRADQPFVTVDCAALTPTLMTSELFGHEKGAFTGADRQYIGAFERANGGTVFLDEIGELPASMQPQLLGAVERRSFRRVGGQKEIEVDVRLVSATNRDLRIEVNQSRFRLDLFYRIAVMNLQLPALRDRMDDVPLLVKHFARECGHQGLVEDLVGSAAFESLMAHAWPGNVRELRNWVEASVAMGQPASIEGRAAAPTSHDARGPLLPYKTARSALLTRFERDYVPRLLDAAEGNVAAAARLAGIDRSYLIRLMRRHGLR